MSIAQAVAQSDGLTVALTALNVVQTVALAWIAARSTRVRAADRRRRVERRRQPAVQPAEKKPAG